MIFFTQILKENILWAIFNKNLKNKCLKIFFFCKKMFHKNIHKYKNLEFDCSVYIWFCQHVYCFQKILNFVFVNFTAPIKFIIESILMKFSIKNMKGLLNEIFKKNNGNLHLFYRNFFRYVNCIFELKT